MENKFSSVSDVNDSGITPLHIASSEGFLQLVHYLTLKHKCDPLVVCRKHKETCLHLAASGGFINTFSFFVNILKCDPNVRDIDGNSPLHLAAVKGQLDFIKFAIKRLGCDPVCKNCYEHNVLHAAVNVNQLHVVKYLLEEKIIDSTSSPSILHVAAENGCTDTLKYLVEEVKLNKDLYEGTLTPLSTAAMHGHLPTLRYLLKIGCKFSHGFFPSPLHCAAGNGHLEIVRYLVTTQEVDPMCPDALGCTPIHFAAFGDAVEVAKFLVKECPSSLMKKNKMNEIPLQVALKNRRGITALFLITAMYKLVLAGE